MNRSTIRLMAALVAVPLLLGACQTTKKDDGGNANLSGTFTIGVWGPASIPQGKDIRDGADLAAEELNKANGAGGRRVKTVFCDSIDGAQTAKATDCVKKFIQTDKVDAIVGGFSSGETLAVLQTVVDGQTPFLATGAAAPDVVKDVTNDGPRKYIFRIGPINSTFLAIDMCGTMLKLAAVAKFQNFAILYEDVEFARPLQAFLSACLVSPKAATKGAIPAETGVKLVSVLSHAVDATDFSGQFKTFADKKAQYVIEINSRQEGVALVKQWGETKPKFALGGINVASQADAFFDATGKTAAFELNGPAGSVRAPITPKTEPFYDSFKAKFGRFPIYNGVSTYDAVYALAEAVDRAKSVEPDAVVAEMAKTDRVGAQGVERFGPNHDIVYGPVAPDKKGVVPLYFQWTSTGEKKLVFPAELAGGNTYQLPDWLT